MSVYRILVVEDEVIVAMDLEDRLSRLGYETIGRVSSGEEALDLAGERRPDLVLMDIRLRGRMDGIAAAAEIRRLYHVPVIFLTAYSEDATLNRAKLTEPFGYILKPIEDRALKSTIEIALYRHRNEEEVRRLRGLYEMHTLVDQAILRSQDPDELLSAVCRAAVEDGPMDLAWIGSLDRVTCRILPVAQFGIHREILGQKEFYATDGLEGCTQLGTAILDGLPFVCSAPCESSRPSPAGQSPVFLPSQSCAALPIRLQGRVHYVLMLCTDQRAFFQDREIKLLKELAQDIAYALDKMEDDIQREVHVEQVQTRSEFLLTLLDALPIPAFYKDEGLRYLGCNTAFENLLGVGRDRLIGRTPEEIWPRELADRFRSADEALLASASRQVYDAEVEKPDGTRSPVRFHKAAFKKPDGSVGGIIGVVEEIAGPNLPEESTAGELVGRQNLTEEPLQERGEMARALIDQASEGLALIDTQTLRFMEFNEAAHRSLGFTREEFAQLTLLDIQGGMTRAEVMAATDVALQTGRCVLPTRLRCKNGDLHSVQLLLKRVPLRARPGVAAVWHGLGESKSA